MNKMNPAFFRDIPVAEHFKVKNDFWSRITPNEYYTMNPDYAEMVETFSKLHGVGSRKWVEVRIVNSSSQVDLKGRWWNDGAFMEKIFWVYHKTVENKKGKNYRFYVLEPMEVTRVVQISRERLGYNPWGIQFPCLLIPTECCELAWKEMAGGYSEHLRPRPEPTAEEKELAAKREETIKEAVKNVEVFEPDLEKFGIKPKD